MKFLVFYIVSISLLSAASVNNRKTTILPQGRIARGHNAVEGQFPYMVGLVLQEDPEDEDYEICGGSLIGNEWILTAAHCIENNKQANVSLGATDIFLPEVSHTVSWENIIVYPGSYFDNDIALIKIPFTNYTRKIKSVRLPSFASINDTYSGKMAELCGWGLTSVNNTMHADHLQWAKFMVIENSLCAETYGPRITSNICVATDLELRPCLGDSGGALVLKSSNTQIGLYSFSYPWDWRKNEPAAFTRITNYLAWIKHHTGIFY